MHVCHPPAQMRAGSMARNMADLILLDGVFRSTDAVTRGHAALPFPGVPCAAPVDESYSLRGIRIGLPMNYWEMSPIGIDPAVQPWFRGSCAKLSVPDGMLRAGCCDLLLACCTQSAHLPQA